MEVKVDERLGTWVLLPNENTPTYHSSRAFPEMSLEHGLHGVAAGHEDGLMRQLDAVIQVKRDVSKETTLYEHLPQTLRDGLGGNRLLCQK